MQSYNHTIIQEAGSYRVAIRPDRRRQLLDEVKQQLPLALQLMSACLAENGVWVYGRVCVSV